MQSPSTATMPTDPLQRYTAALKGFIDRATVSEAALTPLGQRVLNEVRRTYHALTAAPRPEAFVRGQVWIDSRQRVVVITDDQRLLSWDDGQLYPVSDFSDAGDWVFVAPTIKAALQGCSLKLIRAHLH